MTAAPRGASLQSHRPTRSPRPVNSRKGNAMGMFSLTMSEEQCEQFRQQLTGAVSDHINGEELVAVGAFRRGGAAGSYAASKAGGGLVYAALSLGRKKKAGGLPDKVLL